MKSKHTAFAGTRESNALLASLQALARKVCCVGGTGSSKHGRKEPAVGSRERSGLRVATTLTLMHILRGLSTRATGVLPEPSPEAGAPWWRQVAAHTAALCKLPADLRLQWDGLCCWCFGGAEAGGRDTPALLSWKLEPSPFFADILAQRTSCSA